jgi:hypothetical protein
VLSVQWVPTTSNADMVRALNPPGREGRRALHEMDGLVAPPR